MYRWAYVFKIELAGSTRPISGIFTVSICLFCIYMCYNAFVVVFKIHFKIILHFVLKYIDCKSQARLLI